MTAQQGQSGTVAPPAVACVACSSAKVAPQRTVNGFEIDACAACGLRFVPPHLLERVDYDELYREGGDYNSHVSEAGRMKEGELVRFPKARRLALEEIRSARPASLLEVGCGVGNFLQWVEGFGVRAFGIDPSGNATTLARQSLKSATIETGFLTRDTFPDQRFDVICAWEVLEHVSDVNAFMSIIADCLAPGGVLYMSTPNYDSDYLWTDMPSDRRSRPPVHVTFWNSASLATFLDRYFATSRVQTLSVPVNAARRSVGGMSKWTVYPHAILSPKQRLTLTSRSRKA